MPYGCFNRPPLHDFLLVQDGWVNDFETPTRIASYKTIEHTMSVECRYHLEHDDPGCRGCRHNTRGSTNTE